MSHESLYKRRYRRAQTLYLELPQALQERTLEAFRTFTHRGDDLAEAILTRLFDEKPALKSLSYRLGRDCDERVRGLAHRAAQAFLEAVAPQDEAGSGLGYMVMRCAGQLLALVLEQFPEREASRTKDAALGLPALIEGYERVLADGSAVSAAYQQAISEMAGELYQAVGKDSRRGCGSSL
jgi:hypothetical protein